MFFHRSERENNYRNKNNNNNNNALDVNAYTHGPCRVFRRKHTGLVVWRAAGAFVLWWPRSVRTYLKNAFWRTMKSKREDKKNRQIYNTLKTLPLSLSPFSTNPFRPPTRVVGSPFSRLITRARAFRCGRFVAAVVCRTRMLCCQDGGEDIFIFFFVFNYIRKPCVVIHLASLLPCGIREKKKMADVVENRINYIHIITRRVTHMSKTAMAWRTT